MRCIRLSACLLLLVVASPFVAEAQTPGPENLGPAKEVLGSIGQALADPTTYMPAIVDYAGKKLDWDSSQVFFRNGYGETNASFTTNGIAGGPAIGRGAGDRKILSYSLQTLGWSFAHNAASGYLERQVLKRAPNPNQRRLWRAVFLAERVVVASLISMRASEANYKQWQINNRRAISLGLQNR